MDAEVAERHLEPNGGLLSNPTRIPYGNLRSCRSSAMQSPKRLMPKLPRMQRRMVWRKMSAARDHATLDTPVRRNELMDVRHGSVIHQSPGGLALYLVVLYCATNATRWDTGRGSLLKKPRYQSICRRLGDHAPQLPSNQQQVATVASQQAAAQQQGLAATQAAATVQQQQPQAAAAATQSQERQPKSAQVAPKLLQQQAAAATA